MSCSPASILFKVGPSVGHFHKPASEHAVAGWNPEAGGGERATSTGGGKDALLKSSTFAFSDVTPSDSKASCMYRKSCQAFPSSPPKHRRQQQELLKLQQQQALQLAQQPQAKLSGWGSVAKQPTITKSLLEIQKEEAQQMKQRKEQQQPQQHPVVTQQIRNQTRTVRDKYVKTSCGRCQKLDI